MFRYRNKLLIAALALAPAIAVAQTEADITSDSVQRVGNHLTCQCGACKENLNCQMSSGQCEFCKPARTRIFKMQQSGMGDDGVIQTFVAQYGKAIFRPDPNSLYWVVPAASVGLGLGAIWLFIRRSRHNQPAVAGVPSGVAAKYQDAAARDLEEWDS